MKLVFRAPVAAEIDRVVALLGRQLDEHGIQVAELGGAVRKVFGEESLGRLLVAAHARAANLYARNGFQPVERRRMNLRLLKAAGVG